MLFGEATHLGRHAGWLWVPLLALIAAPFPFAGSPLPERALPIFWLCLAGGLCLLARLAAVSWPAAALILWAFLRCVWNGLSIDPMSLRANALVMEAGRARPLQLLVLLAFVALLYVAAREMPRRVILLVRRRPITLDPVRCAAWARAAGVAYEWVFGYLNLWGIYPWMTFVLPEQVGRPMGFLTHPNYWGSFMALGLPVVWSLGGFLPALAIFAVIVVSFSAGPVIAATAGMALLAWPHLARRWRYGLIASASAVVTAVLTVHEWRLSGRWENWAAAWPELMRYPVIGQGLGSWRIWADHFNTKLSMQTGKPEVFATLQAHSEPYQLWFELGLIGLFLCALWALQAVLAAWTAWSADEPALTPRWWQPGFVSLDRAWVAVLVTGVVNGLGSPVFHLPGQAAIVIFALGRCQAIAAETLTHYRASEPIRTVRIRVASGRRPKPYSVHPQLEEIAR